MVKDREREHIFGAQKLEWQFLSVCPCVHAAANMDPEMIHIHPGGLKIGPFLAIS